ncbi:MAG: tetratricopeptide repeat protein [Balneolaceae bacterium]
MSRLKDENLEEDLLIEYSSRTVHYYKENKATVISGLIGILLIIGLGIGYFLYMQQQETEAQNLLGTAEQALMSGNYEVALNGNEEELTLGFSQIANNYRRTNAGNLALYYAAVVEYELENYESALSYIEQFSVPEGIVGVGTLSLHAVILSELGEHEAAAEKFMEAANWDENESTTPYHLMEAALSYRDAGQVEQARQNVETILRDYPNSTRIADAERLRGALAAQ